MRTTAAPQFSRWPGFVTSHTTESTFAPVSAHNAAVSARRSSCRSEMASDAPS